MCAVAYPITLMGPPLPLPPSGLPHHPPAPPTFSPHQWPDSSPSCPPPFPPSVAYPVTLLAVAPVLQPASFVFGQSYFQDNGNGFWNAPMVTMAGLSFVSHEGFELEHLVVAGTCQCRGSQFFLHAQPPPTLQ